MAYKPDNRKPIEGWEILASLPAYLLLGYLLLERHEVFTDAVRDYSNDSSLMVLCWAPIAILILLSGKPWLLRSKYGSQVRFGGLVFCSLALFLVFSALYPPNRYRLFRTEVLHMPLGIAVSDREIEEDLPRYILNQQTGPMVLEDGELLKGVAKKHGGDLVGHDQTAALVWRALRRQGATFSELWGQGGYEEFFLACWLAQSRGRYELEPDFIFEWTETLISQEPGLLEKTEIQTLKERLFAQLGELRPVALEALLVLDGQDPENFSMEDGDRLLAAWRALSPPEFLNQLEQGLAAREQLKEFVGEPGPRRVAFHINGMHRSSYQVSMSGTSILVESGLLSLLSSCGAQPELSSWEEADIRCEIELKTSKKYNYARYYHQGFDLVFFSGERSLDLSGSSFYWTQGKYLTERVWPFGIREPFLLPDSHARRFGY